MESSNQFLGTERIGKLMQKYAIPCIISLLVGALYNIVDQIFIANASYLGSYGNALAGALGVIGRIGAVLITEPAIFRPSHIDGHAILEIFADVITMSQFDVDTLYILRIVIYVSGVIAAHRSGFSGVRSQNIENPLAELK